MMSSVVDLLCATAVAYGKPKTIEEWQSEAEKWEKQSRLAQEALLAMTYSLSNAMKACATLEEGARLTALQTCANIRDLKARVEEAEAELVKLRADLVKLRAGEQAREREDRRFEEEIDD